MMTTHKRTVWKSNIKGKTLIELMDGGRVAAVSGECLTADELDDLAEAAVAAASALRLIEEVKRTSDSGSTP